MARIIARATASAPSTIPVDWRGKAGPDSDVVSARVRAARLLMDARAQARAIITDAHITAREVAVAESRQGWEQGYAQGQEQAYHEGSLIAQQLTGLVNAATLGYEQSLHNTDADILSLSVAIARAIVHREVETDREIILHVVQEALGEMSVEANVTLRVHPSDSEILGAHLPLPGVPASTHVAVVGDPAISPGGCSVESGAGRVDATVEARLARIEYLLHEHFHPSS